VAGYSGRERVMDIVAPARRAGFAPFETFRSPGYRCLWAASLLWNQARWMDQVVLGWVVLEMTNSAWHLAVIGALRWLPLRMDQRSCIVAGACMHNSHK